MKNLIREILELKGSDVKKTIDARVREFEVLGKGPDKMLFSELCFCLMTANFQAEKSMKIQCRLCDSFACLPEKRLSLELRKMGHRFPNTRANYIFEARKHNALLKNTLESIKDDIDRRDWLVKNVKGLGMKEASHFLRNIGYKNYAIIDFHIIDLLSRNKLIQKPLSKSISKKEYFQIEKVLQDLGMRVGLNQSELDLYLWYMETGKILK